MRGGGGWLVRGDGGGLEDAGGIGEDIRDVSRGLVSRCVGNGEEGCRFYTFNISSVVEEIS